VVLRVALTDLDRARADAGIYLRALARASGVSEAYLSMIVAGRREPSIAVMTAVARALGGDLSVRFYPNTGPVIHDRIQARIVEELLRIAAPTWTKSVEVPVYRPARGFIDVVFDSRSLATSVASEVESRIDRLEQQLRWAQEKAASLPSSELWGRTEGDRAIQRLLVLRTTAATRAIARRFDDVLRTAYPASAAQVFASLTTGTPWPGHGILWADVEGDDVRIRDRPPRGVEVGR
jgi:transcriptional regulator with XRE-family HTH domain